MDGPLSPVASAEAAGGPTEPPGGLTQLIDAADTAELQAKVEEVLELEAAALKGMPRRALEAAAAAAKAWSGQLLFTASFCEELQLQLLRLGAVTSAAVTRLGTVTVEASPCLRL
ncbi:hypothetical protein EMIHUDRAFT_242351 [Emiliania huxleyi CCMP1516]|uniref:Uncharacterized protein n=2 Tax=Emiliania huxleyi TaxID=2903 RepID=A0A0D3J9J6_EMIH1|nr:hypothetical protein EMIHUDRAFT_242351 [Emiliania huxleyi CCMP1516]EOD20181.1 hypothetical protein EMIHUDRAFT_242351 [Emiliania huxleyi CCMP1516]|eukprot:XP_005772610.1 hypothetical protein EMIHUDRAFT_242351 [Emiliania huxleyi CCMP1516]